MTQHRTTAKNSRYLAVFEQTLMLKVVSYHDGEKLKGPLGQKARSKFFQVSYEHDSQYVLMLIDERCWRILNGVHRTFFRKNILV